MILGYRHDWHELLTIETELVLRLNHFFET